MRGFTLIEVIVALAILAVTLAALSRSAVSSVHHAERLRMQVMANWVAQNRLALHRAHGDFLPIGIQTGEDSQAGQNFPWEEEIASTPNPALRRIVVRVYAPNDKTYRLCELTGYLVQTPR